jgi:hypothetical protein
MADLKEDFAVISSTVIAGVGAFLSWFYQSGLLGTLTGIMIGAGITYFVDKRTQKRVWKREYAVKATEQVYGELYGEVKTIAAGLSEENTFFRQITSQQKWAAIANDHRYFMVDEEFREQLDRFYKALDEYNISCYYLDRESRRALIKCAKISFDREPDSTVNLLFTYYLNKVRHDIPIETDSHLRRFEAIYEMEKNELFNVDQTLVKGKQFKLTFNYMNYQLPPYLPPTSTRFEEDNVDRITAYWNLCLQSLKQDANYSYVKKEKPALLKEAIEIKKSIEKRISEPWKI